MILQGDARALPLPDESIDLIVTSPPYFALRSYEDRGSQYEGQVGAERSPREYLEALISATAEMVRTLKPTGSIFVNLGDKYQQAPNREGPMKRAGEKAGQFNGRARRPEVRFVKPKSLMGLPWRYAIKCMDELGLVLRAEIVWSKPNGLPDAKALDRVRRSHETWFHFIKTPGYFCDLDQVREPHAAWTLKAYEYEQAGYSRRSNQDRVDEGGFKKAPVANPLGKVPGSVWTVALEPLSVPADLEVDHFAAFPTEWPRRLILGWCPPDGIVLDPFGGTGTVALVAEALGRSGISVDLSHDYCRLARWRVEDSGHGVKALSRTWAERQEGLAV